MDDERHDQRARLILQLEQLGTTRDRLCALRLLIEAQLVLDNDPLLRLISGALEHIVTLDDATKNH